MSDEETSQYWRLVMLITLRTDCVGLLQLLPRVCATTERVIQSVDLPRLVRFSTALSSQDSVTSLSSGPPADMNRLDRLVSVLQTKVQQLLCEN